jgi:serine/threonine-protein kinase
VDVLAEPHPKRPARADATTKQTPSAKSAPLRSGPGRTPIARLAPIGRAGRYEILGRLAEGGMAKIYLARVRSAAGLERIVVVKHLSPEAQDAEGKKTLVMEAKLLSRLSHPAVVSIEELGEENGRHYLAMEWVRGVSLRRLLGAARDAGGLPWPIAARLFASVAAGLHHVHVAKDEQGRSLHIVHRDVTPENIIVSWTGAPKLLDFGIAKSAIDPQKTRAGLLKGKLQFMAPEQFQSKTPDARADVFSLGATMYETLTGESLYERASELETVAAIMLDAETPSVRALRPDVPEAFDAVLQGALARERSQRTRTADAISVALEELLLQNGERVRDADVAGYLAELFPGQAEREPDLDRSAPFGEPTRKNDLEQQLLRAEAEMDADEYLAAAKQRQRTVMVLVLGALLVAGGVLAWALLYGPGAAP